ncbi:TIR domain-containing protein [Phytohabitans suffuscus]|uniref:CD-NTase-associated protein 12/Pycsar effector protein TIR domain-containing protein n=1 Tax=Phytohabitans suffuscus TaxID=624315 RepID=A0A6F8YDK2_9ACTN|nr:nucleotide-binding protein [Phytohabitans suffuscus]BCB84099.1 hypothetical protein Psuf_014120 [Phytohabitans suffuscus]
MDVERGSRLPSAGPSSRDIFVIHGRDEQVREPFFEFLRAVDLRPLEWEALVSGTGRTSPSLLDVVETALARAGAVVALLTPDDIVQLHPSLHQTGERTVETKPSLQPRPNVLVELGMALGICRDRTIIVEIGDLRPVADLGGINVIRFDGTEHTLGKLVQRLRSAGCPVDEGGNDWRSRRRFANLEAFGRKPE